MRTARMQSHWIHSRCTVFAAAVVALALSGVAHAQSEVDRLTGQQIVERSLDTNNVGFQNGDATITLIIQSASGSSRERRMRVRGMEEGGLSRTIVRVLAPSEVAGQSYLFREREGADDEVFIYLPALDSSARRISGNQKNGAFMGSDFSYADLESRSVRDGRYRRLDDEELAGFEVYVVDVTPSPGQQSDDARVRMWVRKGDFIPLRVRFFDESDQATRTIFTEELAQDGDKTYVRRMSMRQADGSATIMIVESLDSNAAFDASMFTPQELAN